MKYNVVLTQLKVIMSWEKNQQKIKSSCWDLEICLLQQTKPTIAFVYRKDSFCTLEKIIMLINPTALVQGMRWQVLIKVKKKRERTKAKFKHAAFFSNPPSTEHVDFNTKRISLYCCCKICSSGAQLCRWFFSFLF